MASTTTRAETSKGVDSFSCTDLVVRPEITIRDIALELVASSMPQGEKVIRLAKVCEEGCNSASNILDLFVLNFPFQEHGVGGVVWQAAIVLAQYVFSRASLILAPQPDRIYCEVIELGCGSAALGGLACATCANCRVTFTDFPDILKLTRKTLRRNQQTLSKRGSFCRSIPLVWGEALPQTLTAVPFDLILAADVIYRSDLHASLLRTISMLVELALNARVSTVRVLLAFQVRHPVEEAQLLGEGIAGVGMIARDLPLDSSVLKGWRGGPIRLVELIPISISESSC